MKVAVAQLGARMHYAVPAILEQDGRLEHLYTDIYAGPRARRLLRPLAALPGGNGLQRFFGRVPQAVPAGKISAFNRLGWAYAMRRRRAVTAEAQARVYLWAGRAFCAHLTRQDLGTATHTFTYNSAGLEWMLHAKARGLKAIMEQTIAPKQFELSLLQEEQERYPGWEETHPGRAEGAVLEFCGRERAEWDQADLILCGSQFVKDGVAACGGPVDRCVVVPYGVALPPDPPARDLSRSTGPLRVLTVGAVGLRKGSPTVLETARRLKGLCEFRMVGPLTASPQALARLAQEVDLRGPVPRSSIREHYAWADVFFLPSVCEGSATVVYEALATGLPVLTTPNAGSVVAHGEDGWLVPRGDVDRMVEPLAWLHDNRPALRDFSARALEKARLYDIPSYSRRLLRALD